MFFSLSNPRYELSLRSQRSGVKQSHILRLLHSLLTYTFVQNWDAPQFYW
ncbi:hypothetical protein GXM_06699 [Nostoc sphaeroides CCNUC1]|uniref:Uncharacterized protein n=1 Tax=Nostoc sphaeroides CCNUC1 TaxID=2653204 RepID=A0A5P8W8X3_9NOSO|nr:hypothetical protein GXM_06699 [Nostoc sphaeroides CCNUC1]